MTHRDPLEQLATIQAQVLRSELSRAFKAAPTAMTGVLALGMATWQELFRTPGDPREFAWSWLGLAIVSFALCAAELLLRARRAAPDERRRFRLAVEQILPPLLVGGVLSGAFLHDGLVHWLPGVWALTFALVIGSARPFLPRSLGSVAAFYAIAGVGLLVNGMQLEQVQPLGMGLTFGVGQLWCAHLLRIELENPARRNVT